MFDLATKLTVARRVHSPFTQSQKLRGVVVTRRADIGKAASIPTFAKGYPGERFLRTTIALLGVRSAKRRRRIAASSTGTTAPAVRWSFLLMD
ncbi:MAG TPA: hypothetical protein VES69_14670 [Pyrinomonadaceae bacterium]|nr:hypothetical protein [Pyrinomonadaceae bacterium]